jgi:hypothetical protein
MFHGMDHVLIQIPARYGSCNIGCPFSPFFLNFIRSIQKHNLSARFDWVCPFVLTGSVRRRVFDGSKSFGHHCILPTVIQILKDHKKEFYEIIIVKPCLFTQKLKLYRGESREFLDILYVQRMKIKLFFNHDEVNMSDWKNGKMKKIVLSFVIVHDS